MNRVGFAVVCLFFSGVLRASALLLAGWDFQNPTNGGTVVVSGPTQPTVFFANVGLQAGTAGIYLDGDRGSSLFDATNEVFSALGTDVNIAGTDLAGIDNPGALQLKGAPGPGNSVNGKSVVFELSTLGYENLVLTYATDKASGETGFNSNSWYYSTIGTNVGDFVLFVTGLSPEMTWSTATVNLSSVTALNDKSLVWLKFVPDGASTSGGANNFDNFQFNAVLIPEPNTILLTGAGLLLLGIRRRRR